MLFVIKVLLVVLFVVLLVTAKLVKVVLFVLVNVAFELSIWLEKFKLSSEVSESLESELSSA